MALNNYTCNKFSKSWYFSEFKYPKFVIIQTFIKKKKVFNYVHVYHLVYFITYKELNKNEIEPMIVP